MAKMQLSAAAICVAIVNSKHHQQIPRESCSKLTAMPISVQLAAIKMHDIVKLKKMLCSLLVHKYIKAIRFRLSHGVNNSICIPDCEEIR